MQSKERENNFLRREVERVTAERNSLEAALQSEKAYVRRLEHKMTAGGPDTAAQHAPPPLADHYADVPEDFHEPAGPPVPCGAYPPDRLRMYLQHLGAQQNARCAAAYPCQHVFHSPAFARGITIDSHQRIVREFLCDRLFYALRAVTNRDQFRLTAGADFCTRTLGAAMVAHESVAPLMQNHARVATMALLALSAFRTQ